MKKALFWFCVFAGCVSQALAEDVMLKDGNVVRNVGLRRDGAFIFGKPENGQDILIPANNVARVVFRESSGLRDARDAFYAGDSRTVLDNTIAEMTYHKTWIDVPGSMWTTLMRLRVPALVAGGRPAEVEELLRDWVTTTDPELEAAIALLKLKSSGASKEDLVKAYKQATEGYPATLAAAIAWIETGNAALDAKDWSTAMRNFVSVQVFAPSWRPLHPVALMGALKASQGYELPEQVVSFAEDLKADYPRSAQAKVADKYLKSEK